MSYTLLPGELWPRTPSGAEVKIEVFGATGDLASGKTILVLSLAPGLHPKGHQFQDQPRTLYFDFEKSAGTYGGTGAQRVDVPLKMIEKKGGEYTPRDIFEYFLGSIERLQPRQFDVLAADPISDLEGGLVEYVKAHHKKFGMTQSQMEKAGGVFWGAVKDYWKFVLLKLSAKVQCFAYTSHLRQVFAGGAPTGKLEPKGKETLMELASLYLWLERKPDDKGNVPEKPSAIVLKQRLADTRLNEQGQLEVINLMPPRIPVCTVDAIRGYIANPPNYAKLKAGERLDVRTLSEEERLRLELARAEADRDSSVAKLEFQSRAAELRAMMHATADPATAPPPVKEAMTRDPSVPTDAELAAAQQKAQEALAQAERLTAEQAAKQQATETAAIPPVSAPPPPPRGDEPATAEQLAEAKALFGELAVPREKLESLLKRMGAAKVSDLKRDQLAMILTKLRDEKAKRGGK